MPKISAILSIHNRAKLLHRALRFYERQTMDPKDFEIIVIDDLSTCDLGEVIAPFKGKLNVRHVLFDHRRLDKWKRLNPAGQGAYENWTHSPGAALNAGFALAQSPVLCLCHPEVIHAPANFEIAYDLLVTQAKPWNIFGHTYLGTLELNRRIDVEPAILDRPWTDFMGLVQSLNTPTFGDSELYWYCSFLTRDAAHRIRGCNLEYVGDGLAADDDEFKARLEIAGFHPALRKEIVGIHQSHDDEPEKHRQRETAFWKNALQKNRTLWYGHRNNGYPRVVNPDMDWTCMQCVVGEKQYVL